jgi:hypothetical protein
MDVFRNPTGPLIMERLPSAPVRENPSRTRYLTFGERKAGDSSVDFLLGARVDSAWILGKFGTQFNDQVLQNLKKAVYAIGQGGRRWFSGGGELSERQASTILDYLVLVELLLQCRDDLRQHREDLLDCREQLVMQVHRHTEGQPERVAALVNVLVHRFKQQSVEEKSRTKAR